MLRVDRWQVIGHDVLEIQTAADYRPYDRLILRDTKGRTIWTTGLRVGRPRMDCHRDTLPARLPSPSPAPLRGAPGSGTSSFAISLASPGYEAL